MAWAHLHELVIPFCHFCTSQSPALPHLTFISRAAGAAAGLTVFASISFLFVYILVVIPFAAC